VRVPAAASPTANAIVFAFLYKAVFAAMWGLALGVVSTLWLATIFNSPVIEITITLSAAYLTFFSAEALEMSGVLAVVALGLYMGKEGKPRISPEVGHFLAEFWEMLAFVGNTVVFVIAGLVISYRLDFVAFTSFDVGVHFLLYATSTFVRGAIVACVWAIEQFLLERRVDGPTPW